MTIERIERCFKVTGVSYEAPEKQEGEITIEKDDFYKSAVIARTLLLTMKPSRALIVEEFDELTAAIAAVLFEESDEFYMMVYKALKHAAEDEDSIPNMLRMLADMIEEDEDE